MDHSPLFIYHLRTGVASSATSPGQQRYDQLSPVIACQSYEMFVIDVLQVSFATFEMRPERQAYTG